ncbi:phenylalanine--tRNA ligase beta subunit-related protein [Pyrobaculum sp. 3827-6]|uniref:B3/B4 domain-containing protein n=1 Tax=Pyrobaculum sp. 3827-6 TaxID=2983604 RepID=UPI0021D989C6|nr:phenylalanine--tRNA ligase beta subunit-related protein [Pyrobaculum sp. 3827-6]MCU7787248.1 phenylalanine--tRNA ligase beta subunit-related protein [Pyrobaculum sp. 3827-6]
MEIVNEVRNLGVYVAYDVVAGVDNMRYVPQLEEEVRRVVEEVRRTLSLDTLKDHLIIRAYRDFYWRVLGIDPTKQRPAQEALLRRVLRGEPLPRINPAVDAGNAASIKYMVPIGLYDIAKIRGGVLRIRFSRKGEVFRPIGGSPIELDNQIVLASDSQILHIYPYRDSVETKIEESTRDILVVVAGVAGVGEERLVETARYLRNLFSLLGGAPVGEIRLA